MVLDCRRCTGVNPSATKKPAKDRPLEMVPLILVRDERPEPPPQVAKLCDELFKAKGDQQSSLIARLRDDKDSDSTDALALAIPKLAGDIRQQARDALATRLTRLTATELRGKLQDDPVEMRCAAAAACQRKKDKQHVPDLLSLLDDPEMVVVQAARAALAKLTGKDFGPKSEADRRSRAEAAAAWRKWWQEQRDNDK
jgi:HEAT repeat protein